MILLQIVLVSPETHLVKNHESLSTNASQSKNTRGRKLKMLGPLCNQTVNLETDSKALYYSLLKLKYSPSIAGLHVTLQRPCWWSGTKAFLPSGN